MDSTSKQARGRKRLSSAALVIGSTVAVLVSPLAIGSAAAATTAVAIVPAGTTTTMAHGGTATINYSVTTNNGTETGAQTTATVNSGPDAGQTGVCAPETGPVANVFSGSCTFTNLVAGAGPDVLRVTNGAQHADASVALTGAKSTTTSVTIDAPSQNQNLAATSTATINVHYLPAPGAGQDAPLLYLATVSGADGAADPSGVACKTNLNGTGSCSLPNTHGPGTDTVWVFADNNGSGSRDATAPADVQSPQTTVTFTGAPASLSITSPSSSATAGTCVVYTINAVDSNNHPAAGQAITVTMNEIINGTPATPVVTFYNGDCATGATPFNTSTNNGNGTFTVAQSKSVQTDNNGQVKVGVTAGNPGSGSVVASTTPTITSTQPMTWTNGGADAVSSLAATPASRSQYVNTVASFSVHVTDSAGNPVQGVQVNRETTSGPDTLAPASCGITTPSGNAVCGVPNSGGTGPDAVTFWVDNNAAGTHTSGPDANEPKTTATATFSAQPTFTTSGVTCVQQLNGPQQGNGVTNCTVSTAQKSVVFTETLKNNGTPVVGAVVDFAATSATLGGVAVTGTNLPSGSATTGATGTATFTVDNPNAMSGDGVIMTAKVGAVSAGTGSATWQSPSPSALSVTPALQSVTKFGAVSVKAQVTDQFGAGVAIANTLNYTVSGRNAKSGQVVTDSSGSAIISYSDTAANPLGTADTISVVDQTNPFNGSATVQYINGAPTAASVVVDSSGSGTSDATCNTAGHTPRTNVALGTNTTVCALVKNSGGEVLAGKTVHVTVSSGQVAKVGGLSSTSTSSVDVTTDSAGVAFVDVTSTKSGAQTVTATADATSGSSTVTYQTPTVAQARNIKVTPSPAAVASGAQQKFTATVTDAFGNPVPNVSVQFTQSGPGNIGGQSSATLTTGTDGTAAVTLSTAAADTGSGSVVATIALGAGGTQCGAPANGGTPPAATAGTCTDTATYAVSKAVVPTTLGVQAAGAHRIGNQELIAATVTNSDGSPAVNQVVRFQITGANTASGSGVTTAKGVAFFAYTPTHAGTDHASAYDDIDNDGIAGATEPSGNLDLAITSGAREKPSLRLTSKHGTVKFHVVSHPRLSHAKVTYYIERLGRFHKIGTNHTGAGGRATGTFKAKAGGKYTFRVKVSGKHGVKSGHSKAKSIRVKG
ncbi:MAG TPA: Ig-like domain-containing protein [Mycobacteriales bacterium]|nr:Ig-like domain-containing protein [Mycobacteriales bacterium]